jgi:hypothetical protein
MADRRRGSAPLRSGVMVSRYQNETDAFLAHKLFLDLLLELQPDNAGEILAVLLEKGKDEGETRSKMCLLLEAWGKVDGAAAIAAVGALEGDGRRRGFAYISAMKGWASTDSDAAKAHLEGLADGFEKGMIMQGLISGMASMDPVEATAYVLKVDAGRQSTSGEEGGHDNEWRGFAVDCQIAAIANAQLQRGMSEATAWAESLPDGSVKSSAFDRVAESYAKNNPEEAAEWVKVHADKA